MQEYRCKFCHRLLFRYSGLKQMNLGYIPEEGTKIKMSPDLSKIEIICPKCKKLCVFNTHLESSLKT